MSLIRATSALLLCAALALAGAPAASSEIITPTFNPEDFSPTNEVTNIYFPLQPGTTYYYKGRRDGKPFSDVLRVTNERKTIAGVSTTVIHDQGFINGRLAENTIDWYAQDKAGNVWYMGEATETLKKNGEQESTEGSWETGVNGAKPGIFMPSSPKVHVGFKQELAPPTAEDQFEVLSLKSAISVPYITTTRALKTKETTPLEKGVVDHKVYALGIGTVLEVTVKGGEERLELVNLTRP